MTATSRESAILQAVVAVVVGLAVNAAVLGGDSSKDGSDPALRSYLAANGLLNRGLFEPAIAEYRSFLSEHGDHEKAGVARYGLAVCLFRLERYDEGVSELAPLRKLDDFLFAAEAAVIDGQCHLARGRYAEAAAAFDDVLRRFGDHEMADDAATGAAEALYRGGKYEDAAARCRELASRRPESPVRERGEFFWAMSDMARNDFGGAADRLASLLKTYPKGAFAGQASLLLAQCYQRGNADDKAIKQYRRMLEKGEERFAPEALLGLGSLLSQAGKYDEAGKALDRLLMKFPTSPLAPQALLQRAHTWFASGEFDRAFDAFRKAGEANGDAAAETTYWMAKCELRRGEFASAAKRLGEAVQRFPENALRAEMHYDRAIALLRGGDADGAVKAITEFTSKFADHSLAAEALQLLAMTEHQRGQYDKSRAHAKAFLERYPNDAMAASVAFLSAESEFLSGKFAEAAKGYREVLSRFPDDTQTDKTRLRLATALYRLDRFDEAEPLLEQVAPAAERGELFRPALLALGDIYFQRGEWKKAETRLTAYLSAGGEAPSADDALMKLAYAKQRQDKGDDALRDYDRLIERFPKSPHCVQAMFERGQILVLLKRVDEAKQSFERMLAEGGDSRFAAHALNHLAAIALQRDDAAEAAKLYERAAKTAGGGEGEIEAVYRQGQALMAGGQYAPAEAAFRRVVERGGKTAVEAEARARLAIAVSRQERYADALTVVDVVERESGGLSAIEPLVRTALRYEKAWCLRALGKSEEAANAYREVLADADGGSVRLHAMLELAELESTAKQYDAATEVLRGLKEALAKDAASPAELREQCLYRLGVCEFEQERFYDSAGFFEELISAFPKSALLASASFFAGEASFKAGRHQKAIAHLTRVAKDFATDAIAEPAMLRLGECQAVLQRWALSEQVFKDYLDRFGDHEQWFAAQFGVGWARENQKRYDEAIEAYQRVVERHQGPTAARAQFQIGQCLFAQKKFESAVRELLKVDILYAYPEWSAAALYEAGRCFTQLGDPAQARKQFTAVTEEFKDTKWAEPASKELSELSAAALPGR